MLTAVGLAMARRAGTRLAPRLGPPARRCTLLRLSRRVALARMRSGWCSGWTTSRWACGHVVDVAMDVVGGSWFPNGDRHRCRRGLPRPWGSSVRFPARVIVFSRIVIVSVVRVVLAGTDLQPAGHRSDQAGAGHGAR